MISFLKPNERLVQAGFTACRAPDGEYLPAVPQYIIVDAAEADPSNVATLTDNERLIMAGTVHKNRKAAEERYKYLLAGKVIPKQADGQALYIKESIGNINPKTKLSSGEELACEEIIADMLEIFGKLLRERRI